MMDPSPIPPPPIQPQPFAPPAPPTPPMTAKSKKGLIISLAIPIALLAVILFCPIPYYQTEAVLCQLGQTCPNPGWNISKSLVQSIVASLFPSTSTQSVRNNIPTPPPPPQDVTVNWKTYTLSYGTFKYPDNYYLDTSVSNASEVTIYSSNKQGPNKYYLSIYEHKGLVQDLVKLGAIKSSQLKPMAIGVYQGYELTGTAMPGGVSETVYDINNVTFYTEIRFTSGKSGALYDDFKKNVTQILSTFKFIDQNSNPTSTPTTSTYTSPEVVDYYSPFSISFPSDWIGNEQKLPNPNGLIFTLTNKNGSQIKIGQYAGDGGRCVYPADSDYSNIEGAGKQFSSYLQLNVPLPAKWRLSTPKLTDKFTQTVCEMSSNAYIDTTRIGSIEITLKGGDSLSDVQKILESIQFKPTSKTKTLFD